jgi:hypothetical protein
MNAEDNLMEVPGGAHERRDVQWQPVVVAGSLLVLLTVLVMLATAGFLKLLEGGVPASSVGWPEEVPGPRLQAVPGRELASYLERQGRELDTYEWVDRSNGEVRVPIGRAMELIESRGLPETDGRFTRLDMVRRKAQSERRRE